MGIAYVMGTSNQLFSHSANTVCHTGADSRGHNGKGKKPPSLFLMRCMSI